MTGVSTSSTSGGSSTREGDGRLKETERIQAGPGHGRGPFGGGMVGQKASSFGPSAKRLLRRMAPERAKAIAVVLLAVASVLLTAVGPKILGRATDLIFAGLIGGQLPGRHVQGRGCRGAAPAGRGQVRRHGLLDGPRPGQGVDFTAVADVLLLVLGGVRRRGAARLAAGLPAQRRRAGTVLRMRADVEDKVNRLPLSYFDRQPRGELLSRVTNDIDNVSQTLQQTMSQLMTSLLTVLAVLSMMFWISPLLALVALVSVPLSMLVAKAVMGRSQGHVRRPVAAYGPAQRAHRGDLLRPRPGQGVRSPARGRGGLRRARTRSSTGPASAPSSSAA